MHDNLIIIMQIISKEKAKVKHHFTYKLKTPSGAKYVAAFKPLELTLHYITYKSLNSFIHKIFKLSFNFMTLPELIY